MRLVLDTHVLLALLGETSLRLPETHRRAVDDREVVSLVSVATLWEIGIKHRQRRLALSVPLHDLPARVAEMRLRILPVVQDHALAEIDPLPETADPFDRLLLAVAGVEGANLLTLDKKLRDHPLAWRPA